MKSVLIAAGFGLILSILLTPVWITKKNYKLLFKDGFVKKSQVCIGPYAKFCS